MRAAVVPGTADFPQHTQQHVVLRPVSGKSNSNRYNLSRSKSKDKQHQQPMYYEDDMEEDF
jgi:hypothetical protein